MEEFLVPILLLLLATLLAFLGVRSRRKAVNAYEDDARRYTGSTTMTVIRVDKTEQERWEEREDGSREVMFDTVYLPTYEYTANGKTYQYSSRQSSLSVQDVGAQVTGYYDPANPAAITEEAPRRPLFGGFLFFLGAVIVLGYAAVRLYGALLWRF